MHWSFYIILLLNAWPIQPCQRHVWPRQGWRSSTRRHSEYEAIHYHHSCERATTRKTANLNWHWKQHMMWNQPTDTTTIQKAMPKTPSLSIKKWENVSMAGEFHPAHHKLYMTCNTQMVKTICNNDFCIVWVLSIVLHKLDCLLFTAYSHKHCKDTVMTEKEIVSNQNENISSDKYHGHCAFTNTLTNLEERILLIRITTRFIYYFLFGL